MFKRILIANRGEIALRVMKTCKEMNIATAAVYSDVDELAAHVRYADRAICIGPAQANESYLNIDKIIDAAHQMDVDAIHPGYGFLSENAEFAKRCEKEGIVFIGPSAEAIISMGDKMIARKTMENANVPVVPGAHGSDDGFASANDALDIAHSIGFPVMLKASAGGGGKGMRLVKDPKDFVSAFEGAKREAIAAFGKGSVYLEKYIENPRHIEVQVMADTHGNVIHLYERDCSIQRRHQKVVEETPSPVIDDAIRQKMGEIAIIAAKAVNYRGAGTIEFLYSQKDRAFYFLEMNTRLQVEHPITELCCGVDLVKMQIEVANGQKLALKQDDIQPKGAAIECRIYAEDPIHFLPSPGLIEALQTPNGPGIRDDSGVYSGSRISPHYDPLISKLSVWASTRNDAINRMRRALSEYHVAGIETNLAFHRELMSNNEFKEGRYDTGFIDQRQLVEASNNDILNDMAIAAAAIKAFEQKSTPSSAPTQSSSAWRDALRWRR